MCLCSADKDALSLLPFHYWKRTPLVYLLLELYLHQCGSCSRTQISFPYCFDSYPKQWALLGAKKHPFPKLHITSPKKTNATQAFPQFWLGLQKPCVTHSVAQGCAHLGFTHSHTLLSHEMWHDHSPKDMRSNSISLLVMCRAWIVNIHLDKLLFPTHYILNQILYFNKLSLPHPIWSSAIAIIASCFLGCCCRRYLKLNWSYQKYLWGLQCKNEWFS